MKSDIEQLKRLIDRAHRIVFFGGAGVSIASGIPDFRSSEGLYSVVPEEVLSSTYFVLHTEEFYEFYRKHMLHPEAKPNAVHRYLYKLEKEDKLRGIVTQNIDGLHKKAGNIRVYELHGSVDENYCVQCDTMYGVDAVSDSEGIPRCSKCGGIIKPGIVLYGENLDKYTCIGATREITNADLMIVAGTSLAVEPAASMVKDFGGKHLVVINKEPTSADEKAELVIREDVEYVFKELEAND